jgi:hypothetical protein
MNIVKRILFGLIACVFVYLGVCICALIASFLCWDISVFTSLFFWIYPIINRVLIIICVIIGVWVFIGNDNCSTY